MSSFPSHSFEQDLSVLLQSGRIDEAVRLTTLAAEKGNSSALMQLSVWRLAGQPLERDLPAARALLRRATEIGHVDAALMEIALTANGSGGLPDWQRARQLLDIAARNDPIAEQQRDIVRTMNLDAYGRPLTVPPHRQLQDAPLVRIFPDFLTQEECHHLARISGPHLTPSVVIDPQTGAHRPHMIRTSDGMVIGPTSEDLVVRAINARIAAVSGTPIENGEPLAILRYSPGQEYKLHSDALPGTDGQRSHTVIVYLNEGFSGGATDFPAIGLRVQPKAGMALLFANLRDDGLPDPLARHAGLPITQGAKWIATRWIRQQRYDPWNPS